MTDHERLAEDLAYVRGVVRDRDAAPASVLLLWAALAGTGFALVDLAPGAVPWYWMVAGPGGFVVSALLGRSSAEASGHRDDHGGRLWTRHWGALMLAIVGVIGLAWGGVIGWSAVGNAVLALLALAYLLAAVHLDRRLVWVGLAFAVSVPLTLIVERGAWTMAGALVALALVVSAGIGLRRDRG